jgi:hypothetical protein
MGLAEHCVHPPPARIATRSGCPVSNLTHRQQGRPPMASVRRARAPGRADRLECQGGSCSLSRRCCSRLLSRIPPSSLPPFSETRQKRSRADASCLLEWQERRECPAPPTARCSHRTGSSPARAISQSAGVRRAASPSESGRRSTTVRSGDAQRRVCGGPGSCEGAHRTGTKRPPLDRVGDSCPPGRRRPRAGPGIAARPPQAGVEAAVVELGTSSSGYVKAAAPSRAFSQPLKVLTTRLLRAEC